MPQGIGCGNGRAAVRTAVLALQVLVLSAVSVQAQGTCPNRTSPAFPSLDWSANATCSVITFAGLMTPGALLQNPLWADGLRMYANHTNAQGGLRLGKGHIGYVEVQLQEWDSRDPERRDPTLYYTNLCARADVDVLLAPVDSSVATDVLRGLKACRKPFLAADTSDELFAVDAGNLWSVEGWNATQKGGIAIDFLHSLGARTFAIVAKERDEYKDIAAALSTAIINKPTADMKLLASRQWTSGASMINEIAIGLEAKKPDVFVAVGDLDMFESLLDEFKGQKYAPNAAVFMEGLAASPYMLEESYTTKGCRRCLIYNQWMGTVPWSEQMPYQGHNNWTAIQGDPYGDRSSDKKKDGRDQRYMGSAVNFGTYARRWLASTGSAVRDPDAYHAKAFASMLLLQVVVELAGDGGLSKSQLGDPEAMRNASAKLDLQTFWGRMKLRKDGFNEGFKMGIAQFQAHDTVPDLVGPDVFRPTKKAVYPAQWPCSLYDNCDITKGWSLWEVLGALFLGLLCAGIGHLCYVRERSGRGLANALKPFLQRSDVFQSRNTDSLLQDFNASGKWYGAANASEAPLDPAPDSAPPNRAEQTRKLRRQASSAPVLFRDQNIGELRPKNWRDNQIGKGSYGTVYRAAWQGKEVAVKELQIPDETPGLTEGEKEAFRRQAKELRAEFLKELKVSCDLNHPNLVRLLGWATHQVCPIVIQEYLGGKSLDHQLYVEKWQPTTEDILKMALDVANGMEYLHTAFIGPDNNTLPVIHRDLKSPNLLLLHGPPDFNGGQGEKQQVWVKIADFGLARNKKLDADSRSRAMRTGMMTGCGSILWMAPEILLGENYNEKVDLFSFAMCLAEMRSRYLPWQGGKQRTDTTQVPYKVTRGERPDWQLKTDREGNPKKDFLNTLIKRCWHQDPMKRPAFEQIVVEIKGQYEASRRSTR